MRRYLENYLQFRSCFWCLFL